MRILVTGGAGFIGSSVESFETGIRRTVDWYLDNEPWWSSIGDRYRGQRLGIRRAH